MSQIKKLPCGGKKNRPGGLKGGGTDSRRKKLKGQVSYGWEKQCLWVDQKSTLVSSGGRNAKGQGDGVARVVKLGDLGKSHQKKKKQDSGSRMRGK